jgi:hypothetical protein
MKEGKEKKRGGQVINKRVRMSDPHKIGERVVRHGDLAPGISTATLIIQLYLNFLARTM